MFGSSFPSPIGTAIGVSLLGPLYIAGSVAASTTSNVCHPGRKIRVLVVPVQVNISLY